MRANEIHEIQEIERRHTVRSIVLGLAFLVCCPGTASAEVAGGAPSGASSPAAALSTQTARQVLHRLDTGVERFVLSNGLRVVFFRRTNAPVFAGQTWVRVGGVDEHGGKTGAAHLLEHMAFKGSKTIGTKDYAAEQKLLERYEVLMQAETAKPGSADPKELEKLTADLSALWIDNEFSRIYQRRGSAGLNAGTSKDYTMYQVELPSVDFELWCWMESDRLRNPVFRQFYKEREVVREERRTRTDDDPQGRLYEALMNTSFTVHPYQFPTIGWPADLRGLITADTEQIFRTYYRPDNMVISIVGDLDPAQVRAQLERYFGRIPKGKGELPKVTAVEPPQTAERRGTVTFDAEPQFFAGYHKPVFPDPDDLYFSILHSAMAEGRSSYLYRELVQGKQRALGISTTEGPGSLFPSLFIVSAVPRQGVAPEALLDDVQAMFDRFAKEPFPDDVFQAAKRRVKVSFLDSLDSNDALAETLGHVELLHGDWRQIFTMFDMVEQATPADVQNLFSKYLRRENRTFVSLVKPQSGTASPSGDAGSVRGTIESGERKEGGAR